MNSESGGRVARHSKGSGVSMGGQEMPLSASLFYYIFILNSVLERAGNRLTEAHDLTLPQWMALGCVGQEERGVTHSELGQRLMLSKAPITGVVDRLERAGYVQRTTSALDRRVSRITITPSGRTKWSDVRQVMREHAESSCAELSRDEQQMLADLLRRLLENVAAGDPMLAASITTLNCPRREASAASAKAASAKEEALTPEGARDAATVAPEGASVANTSSSTDTMTFSAASSPSNSNRGTRRTKKTTRASLLLASLLLTHLPSVRAQQAAAPQTSVPQTWVDAPGATATAPQSTLEGAGTVAAPPSLPSPGIPAIGSGATAGSGVDAAGADATVGAGDAADAPGLGDLRRSQSDAAAPLSIVDAIVLALQNNPQRKAAQAALQAAQARIGTARSTGGPQVNVSGSVSGQRGFFGSGTTFNNGTGTGGTGGTGTGGNNGGNGNGTSNGGSSNGVNILGFDSNQSVGLSASLPLYTGGRVKAATRVAEFNAQAQAARVLQTDSELVLNVSVGYLNVLRSSQLVDVAQSNLDVSRERRRIAGVRFNAGAAARLEVLRAETTLSDARQRRVTAVNSLAQSRSNLNTLLGRDPETPLRLESLQSLSQLAPTSLPSGLEPGPNSVPGGAVPPSTAPSGGATGIGTPSTGVAGANPNAVGGNITSGTTGALPGTTAPNVTSPGATLPGAIGGNAANNTSTGGAGTLGTNGSGAATGGAAGGISVPGVTAPGAAGGNIGTSPGTAASGTVLTNPAGGDTSASQGTGSAAAANSALAAQLGAQISGLVSQSSGDLRTTAGTSRNSLAVTSAQLQAAEAAVEVARAQRRPSVDLSISNFLRNPANFLGRFALTLGLGLAQNVYDSGRIKSQIAEAQFVVDQLRQQFVGQRLDVSNQIEQSLLALDSATRRLGNADSAVVSSAEALRAAQLGYQAGVITALEVSDAQVALLTSQTDAVNARFDLAQSQASLAAAVGVFTPAGRDAYTDALQRAGTATTAPVEEPKRKRRKFLGIF